MAIPVATIIKDARAIRIAQGSLFADVRPDFKYGKLFIAFISKLSFFPMNY